MSRVKLFSCIIIMACFSMAMPSSFKKHRSFTQKIAKSKPFQISSKGVVTPGFRDQKGGSANETHMAYFREIVNLASVFFNNNTNRRVQYISQEMRRRFSGHFTIFILKNPSNWDFSFKYNHTLWGSLSPGVDSIFPNYSYMFLSQGREDGVHQQAIVYQVGQVGDGIRFNFVNVVGNIIRLSQADLQTCNCARMANHIRQLVNQYQSTDSWNILCSSSPNLHSLISAKDQKFMMTKEKCHYLLYEN